MRQSRKSLTRLYIDKTLSGIHCMYRVAGVKTAPVDKSHVT
ncbi:MAG: hypothetical protein OXC79_12065 [Candidatus Poribacteria bacterium]|nr:hypothetical protein [Candidatus Poribacteria bacterium]